MATFVRLPSGSWRAVVRRKGVYISETFHQCEDARRWATGAERTIDLGGKPKTTRIADKRTLADLVDLHIEDLKSVGKKIGRTQFDMLKMLKTDPVGNAKFAELDRLRLIAFGKRRARGGAGPVTLGMYIGTIKTILISVAALHDIERPEASALLGPYGSARRDLREPWKQASGPHQSDRSTRCPPPIWRRQETA